VSRLTLDWLASGSSDRLRVVEGTLAFVDISGFTRLTEMLAARGKAGAEELTSLLGSIFAELLGVAYEHHGEVIKWGGDAVLVFFAGTGHARRTVDATSEMQRRMDRIGSLRTSAGRCRVQMSVGAHSGQFHFLLVGSRHHELIITGPAATTTATMEALAEAGEIVVSPACARQLDRDVVGSRKGPGRLVSSPPNWSERGSSARNVASPEAPGALFEVGPISCLPERLREHLLAGPLESEHRQVAVAFVEFGGTDDLLASGETGTVAAALGDVVSKVQESCARRGVTFWETDIAIDGGKIMLVAGAPSAAEDDAGRLLSVARDIVDGSGPLRLRAGVNYGRVFFGDFGPPYHTGALIR
jgi:class 3 adenylate cyclase